MNPGEPSIQKLADPFALRTPGDALRAREARAWFRTKFAPPFSQATNWLIHVNGLRTRSSA
jgi:hypothetical protein